MPGDLRRQFHYRRCIGAEIIIDQLPLPIGDCHQGQIRHVGCSDAHSALDAFPVCLRGQGLHPRL